MIPDDDFDDIPEETGRAKVVTDSIRKAVITGISALFMTEEGIRGALTDLRMPKEALAYVVQQTDKTRRELFRAVSEEIKGFLKTIDLTGELRQALTGLKVQVRAEIRFVDEGPKARVDTKVVDREPPPPRRRVKRPRS